MDRRERRKEKKVEKLRSKVAEAGVTCQSLIKENRQKDRAISKLEKELDIMKQKLSTATESLKDASANVAKLENQRELALKKGLKLEKSYDLALADFMKSESVIEEMQDTLHEMLRSSESSVMNLSTSSTSDIVPFSFDTKIGKQYSPTIRKLYYSLLAAQIPAGKVASIIKTVLSSFFPDVDVNSLMLPGESCAGYMRREELKTISTAHQATVISEQLASAKEVFINTDGTTKNQKKLNGIAFNGFVLSVNEVPDGKADSIINDIGNQLEKLRKAAYQLGLPNANMINWTLFVASTSDSASTQKRLNSLLQLRKEEDEKQYGIAGDECCDIVENFCAMHLGINLRKAFIGSSRVTAAENAAAESSNPVDSIVHEFAKLFGSHGTPEYGLGCVQFPDFLSIKANDCTCSQLYYQSCLHITLSCQVGSRYFVTSHNAAKVLFLAPAAIEFLKFTGKCDGNKLERSVFEKLQDYRVMTCLKADALMFHHVYADLVTLAKSKKLGKSAYDMRQHYLELKVFLEELHEHPELIIDQNYKVFISEKRLYTPGSTENHRDHASYQCIQKNLFQNIENSDSTLLFSCVAEGAILMKEKLCAYASSQLPGGLYWDPDPKTADILKRLEPSNDLCESMLGLNDYLCTALPNMLQITRSNLVEVKKNHTLEWFNGLPQDKQALITQLAVKNRDEVKRAYREEQKELAKKRQDHLVEEKKKRQFEEEKCC